MFLRDPLVQVLALKLGKLASEQSGIALNIPPMAQNFGGPEVNHRRHLMEMAHNCPSDGEWRVRCYADSPIKGHAGNAAQSGNSVERPYKEKPRCGRGLRLTVRYLKSPVSPSNPIHNADDCGKDYEGSGTEIVNASPAAVLN
jgi:hypothetical protein